MDPDSGEVDTMAALADALFGDAPEEEAAAPAPDAAAGGGGEGEGEEPSEPANAAPTSPFLSFANQDEADAWMRDQLQTLAQQQTETQRRAELQKLIEEGSDEEIGKLYRDGFREQQLRDTYGGEIAGQYAERLLESIATPDFAASLTDADKDRLREAYTKTDAVFFEEIVRIKAEKGVALTTEEEIERRAQERAEAIINNQRGQRLNAGSVTLTPGSTPSTPEWDEMSKSEQWNQVEEAIFAT